jgi:hypothetical protein
MIKADGLWEQELEPKFESMEVYSWVSVNCLLGELSTSA